MQKLLLSSLCSVILAFSFYAASASALNQRPIIGVLTHPADSGFHYLAASYVKWVESAGGRVVPISYNATDSEVQQIVSSVNGLLFPGGGADLHDTGRALFKYAIEENTVKGNYFPFWATCLGFEWTMQYFSGNDNILGGFDAENISLPLLFTPAVSESRLFASASDSLMNIFADSTFSVTMNNHQSGVSPAAFNASAQLVGNFSVLSTNVDRKGKVFVSTVEHKTLPFYASQWHPEKNGFEFAVYHDGTPVEVIRHTAEAILAGAYPVTFLVNEARKNNNRFPTAKDEVDALIYNYKTNYTNSYSTDESSGMFAFEQVYYFS